MAMKNALNAATFGPRESLLRSGLPIVFTPTLRSVRPQSLSKKTAVPLRQCSRLSVVAAADGATEAKGLGVAIGSNVVPSGISTELAVPPAIHQKVIGMGVGKTLIPGWKTALLGILAGFYVSWGAVLMLQVGANCPGLAATNPGLQKLVSGVFGLPLGLAISLITGAELFTGNTSIMTTAYFAGRINFKALIKNWMFSYAGNLFGCILLACTIVAAGVSPPVEAVAKIAVAKTSLPFATAVLRGILANWLVNVGVWMASASTSLLGKVVAAIIPVTIFVSCGLEHSVANMFFIPLGIFVGADITWTDFLVRNLIPVTIGNIIGGAVMVAGVYSLVYNTPAKDAQPVSVLGAVASG